MAKTAGIDLDTTNSVIAVWESGEPSVLPNDEGPVMSEPDEPQRGPVPRRIVESRGAPGAEPAGRPPRGQVSGPLGDSGEHPGAGQHRADPTPRTSSNPWRTPRSAREPTTMANAANRLAGVPSGSVGDRPNWAAITGIGEGAQAGTAVARRWELAARCKGAAHGWRIASE